MKKPIVLGALVCMNAALLGGIVLSTSAPRTAHAQATGLAGNYLMVAGEVRDEFDALYILDLRARVLHGLVFDRGANRLEYTDSRDLERDFRHNRD